MTVPLSSQRPTHKWVAFAGLAWNLLGLLAFAMQFSMNAEQVAALPAADRAVHDATPAWLMAAFALAVGGGVIGSVGLLLRRRWAVPAFAVSLVALLLQIGGGYLATPLWRASGVAGAAMPALLLVVAVLLLRYARRATPETRP